MSNKEEVEEGKMTGDNEEKVIQYCAWTQEEKSWTTLPVNLTLHPIVDTIKLLLDISMEHFFIWAQPIDIV